MTGLAPRTTRAALAALALAAALAACVAAPEPRPAGGSLERITVSGPSLEGALEGDAAERTVFVYLPPSYAAEPRRRYPTLYVLHGYALSAERWVGFLGGLEAFDRAFADGTPEMILVFPDALTVHGGSMYSSSAAIGDWESFIADDLVASIDANYRTIPTRASRGLAGHSMGGYGTLRIGMKKPDVFSSLYSMSACCLSARGVAPTDAALEAITTIEEAAAQQIGIRTTFAASAAWAANPAAPPFYLDLPTKDGEPQRDVLDRYAANAPNVMMHQHLPALESFEAIGLEIGDADFLLDDNVAMHELLEAYGIAHEYALYEGDHVNRVAERFGEVVLPFFAERLDFE